MNESPALSAVVKVAPIADRVEYSVTVTYPGESPERISFSGPASGYGPVVMITPAGQTFVTDPGRLGAFGPQWIRRFFA